jgi:O-antigen ligase
MLLLLCLVGIYFTYTRAAWLATAIGALIMFVGRPRSSQGKTMGGLPVYLAVALVLCVGIFSSGSMAGDRINDSGTIYYRLNVWAAGLRMAAHRPLFGYGFGQFQSQVAKYQTSLNSVPDIIFADEGTVAHNTFMEVLVEHGIIGLALYLAVVFNVVTRAKISSQTGWPSFGASWVIAFTLVYFVNAQFVAAFEPTNNLIYYGTMGLVAGLTRTDTAMSEA